MKTKKLIITLAAIMFVSFSLTPAANAGVFVAPIVIPVAAVFFLVGFIAQEIQEAKEDHQKNEAAADDPLRDNGMILKGENRWAD